MKDLKTISKQQFLILSISTGVVVLFLSLSALDSTRAAISAQIRLPAGLLWLPTLGLLLGLQYFLFRRSDSCVTKPFRRLSQFAERGEQGFAFKNKSSNKEEDTIKHAIESANLRAKEAREQADELEELLKQTQTELDNTKESKGKIEAELEKSTTKCRELILESETLKAAKTAIELTLENERKTKIGVEVEKRTAEIYTQMEQAVSAASMKHIWIPSLVQELKTPISIIRETSTRLSGSWSQASMSQVNDQIELIRKQSVEQLELLDEILSRKVEERPKPKPTLSDSVEADTTGSQPVEAAEPANFPPPEIESARPKLSLDLEPEIEEEAEIEIESDEPEPPALEIGDEPVSEAETETEDSPYALETLLKNLVEEFQPRCALTEISYTMDPDLEIEIEDGSLLELIHALADCATSVSRSGEIIIGVELRTKSIVFDIACVGVLAEQPNITSYARAEQHARNLGGQISVETVSHTELHLSFEYSLAGTDAAEPAAIDIDS